MLIFAWILVLMINPETRMPDHRTQSELEIAERAFMFEEACLAAKHAMELGWAMGGDHDNTYTCVYEETFIAEQEAQP